MTASGLAAALRSGAAGLYPMEAGTALLIEHDVFLARADFTGRFIWQGTSITSGTSMAQIDWSAAITALNAGELPCSGSERQIIKLAASLAAGIPVDLSDAVTGLDDRNIQRLITSIRHASGKRPDVGSLSSEKAITRCWRPATTPAGSRWPGCCAAAPPARTRPPITSPSWTRRSRRSRRASGAS
jgi:hypothetical protein